MRKIIFLAIFFMSAITLVHSECSELLCSPLTCTCTKKTLIRLKWEDSKLEKEHDQMWSKAVEQFSDYKSIFFDTIDCLKRPESCLPFANTSVPSYVMQTENIPIGTCRPIEFIDLEAFVYEMFGGKYQRKHDYHVYKSECDTTFPTLKGISVDSTTFNATVECGLTFVLFHQPKCCHCKKIKGFWNALVNLYEHKGIKFLYIECVEDPDKEFCYSHNAIGFPTMNFYKDGEFVDEYSGNESMREFQEFLDEQLESKSNCSTSTSPDHLSESLEELN